MSLTNHVTHLNQFGASPVLRQPLEAFVDAKAVAAFLGSRFHWKTIQKMARENRIPAHAAGSKRKKWLFLLSEIHEWMKKGEGSLDYVQ